MDKDTHKRHHEAMVNLITAEAEFLSSMGWAPLAPVAEVPGPPISWRSQAGEAYTQDNAMVLAKAHWVQLYER